MSEMKKTVLYQQHLALDAKMGVFGGYQMPLWYGAGARAEHLAVIKAAGLFDTSHMAAITVSGRQAFALLQGYFSKDLRVLQKENKGALPRAVYGVFLTEKAHVLDDAILYQLDEDLFLVVVNAGMGEAVSRHLSGAGLDAEIVDHSDQIGKIDIQGPLAGTILRAIVEDGDELLQKMDFFSFLGGFPGLGPGREVMVAGNNPVFLSRTGYTGEFGFELLAPVTLLPLLWDELLRAGRDYGLLPCGLAARDSLRVGAKLPLSHQDIGDFPFASNPWEFVLPRAEDGFFTKDFLGAEAHAACNWQRHTLAFCGFDPRKIAAEASSWVEDCNGNKIGTILSCTTDMAIGRLPDGSVTSVAIDPLFKARGLCCGFVLVTEKLPPETRIFLCDGKRRLEVEICKRIRPATTARNDIASMLNLNNN